MKKNLKYFFWLSLSACVVLLDQFTKQLAVEHLVFLQPKNVLPFLNFQLAYNRGAAFSFLNEAGGWQHYLFSGVAIGVSVTILVWLYRLPSNDHGSACGLALILGGAIGNLWDRTTQGYVIDFIDVFYKQWHWPAFNIADSAITIGAVMLAIKMFSSSQNKS